MGVPEDLETNWLMLLCPEGRRNFVVAANGSTKVFSKSGKQVKSFPSNLPGGNRNQEEINILFLIVSTVKVMESFTSWT